MQNCSVETNVCVRVFSVYDDDLNIFDQTNVYNFNYDYNQQYMLSYNLIYSYLCTLVITAWVSKHKVAIHQKPKYSEFITKPRSGRPPILTPEEQKEITLDCANQLKQSLRKTARRFAFAHPEKSISYTTIYAYRKKLKMHPFHVIKSPNTSLMNKEARVRLGTHFNNIFMGDPQYINNMIFSDEFLIYSVRKPNTKNDIIWALDRPQRNTGGHSL